jgi:hypothetical protein
MKIADPLSFLLGTWSLTRSIHDHRSGASGVFEGSAAFTAIERSERTGLVIRAGYEESGELRFGTYTSEAHRRLEYVRRGATAVEVFFPDGSPFVQLDFSTGTGRAVHPCRDDHHEIAITVLSGDEIREDWQVSGPQTEYEASALLKRLS